MSKLCRSKATRNRLAIWIALAMGGAALPACLQESSKTGNPNVSGTLYAAAPKEGGGKGKAKEGRLVFSSQKSAGIPAGETSFSISELVNLQVFVWWKSTAAKGQTTLRFLSPDGQLYVTQTTSLAGAESIDGGKGMWTLLPVGGTQISRFNMVGTWRVEASLDDGLSTVGGTFTLTGP